MDDRVIQTITYADQSVQAGETYQVQGTFHIPQDARPSEENPSNYGHHVRWIICVTLKCQNVAPLIGFCPIVVI